MTPKPQKPPKEKDLARRTRFAGIAALVLPFLALIGIVAGYRFLGSSGATVGFLIAVAVSLGVAFLAMALTQILGGSAVDLLYSRRPGLWSLEERMAGPLHEGRLQYRREAYPEALKLVNQVLAQAPQMAEAHLLKAGILWHGYGNAEAARGYLARTLTLAPDDADAVHLKALALENDIAIALADRAAGRPAPAPRPQPPAAAKDGNFGMRALARHWHWPALVLWGLLAAAVLFHLHARLQIYCQRAEGWQPALQRLQGRSAAHLEAVRELQTATRSLEAEAAVAP